MGESGVGKAIAEGLAKMIVDGEVPDTLKGSGLLTRPRRAVSRRNAGVILKASQGLAGQFG